MASSTSNEQQFFPNHLSTVNVSNFVSSKLCVDKQSNNYCSWKLQMLSLLESQDLLHYINGKIPPPQPPPETTSADDRRTSSKDYVAWRTDRIVKAWILGALGETVLQTVADSSTARDVWSTLEKRFSESASVDENPSQTQDVKYPWPSTVNVANFVTVKPSLKKEERTKFNIWKEQMLCLVEGQGLLGFINGEILRPEKANTLPAEESSNVEYEQKLWSRTDRLVKGWILGSIGIDALEAVWEFKTAREVWLELDKIFNEEAAADSEIQSETDVNAHEEGGESDVNAHEEGGESGHVSRYLPVLYKAAQIGDWETAKDFFDKEKDGTTVAISSYSERALHVAVIAGKANDFVNKLVELLPPDSLALTESAGNTALHFAGRAGNVEAARALVTKNPGLVYISNNVGWLPVLYAAIYGHKDLLVYLISCMSKPKVEHNSPFQRQSGITLLCAIVSSQFIDVALKLVEKYPNLAGGCDNDGSFALLALASLNSVFPSGESFSWWQKLIYHCIPLNQPKQRASQATCAAHDIENVISCHPPPYKKYSGSFQIISGGKVTQKLGFLLWKVIENLVPQVNGIRDKKALHKQALELVKCLCKQMVSLPENEAAIMFSESMVTAAKHGISEIVEEIMEVYPEVYFCSDSKTGRNVFLLAASYRFENVFNLIYNLNDRKYEFFHGLDIERNNLMHMCGKLAPPDRLNLVPGAALQMQRELQWFKEAEKFVPPSRRTWSNNKDQTPNMLFTKEHEKLKTEGEKWMKDTANACNIAAALIATVVFAAAFTVPGGIATDSGIPYFWDQFAFILFAISDAVSLFTSVTSLLMFLSILTSRYAEEDFLCVLPKRLSIGLLSLFISITFMMVAFSATLYLIFRQKMRWLLIPVAAFACLPVTSFVLLQFPLLVDVIYSTYGPGIFGKKTDRLLY